jgi:hypothetical protein
MFGPLPETDFVPLDLAASLAGVSPDGLASLLFAEPGETPPLRSAVVLGRELVDLRDLGLFAPVGRPARRKAVRR